MFISPQPLHDLKTERVDVLPPLPMALRLIPILFYLGTIGTIGLVTLTVLQIGKTAAELDTTRLRAADIKKQMAEIQADRTALEGRTKQGVDLQQWVEGSVGVQALAVSINRSISEKSAITELALSRDEKSASQIQLSLKLQAADTSQLDTAVETIRHSGFRHFSAKQSQEGNRINYEATLIRQSAGEFEQGVPTP